MKLVRRIKKKTLVIDETKDAYNPEIYFKYEYEDIIQESLFKKVIKSLATWVLLSVIVIFAAAVILTKDKWVAVTDTIVLIIYLNLLRIHFQSLKKENEVHNNPF